MTFLDWRWGPNAPTDIDERSARLGWEAREKEIDELHREISAARMSADDVIESLSDENRRLEDRNHQLEERIARVEKAVAA